MKSKRLPKFLQPLLWSYNIKEMDIEKDKKLIIQQVLNYSTMKELNWLFKTYSKKEIKDVIRHPIRGCWYRDVLNYWLEIFNIQINKDDHELAIHEIVSSPERQKLVQKLLAKRLGIKI